MNRAARLQRMALPLTMAQLAFAENTLVTGFFLSRHSTIALHASLPGSMLAVAFSSLATSTFGYSGTIFASRHGSGDSAGALATFRAALAPEDRVRTSNIICQKLINDTAIVEAVCPFEGTGDLAVYLASTEEIDLSAFIADMLGRGVTVVSPRWDGETYELAKIKSLAADDLRSGPMNILEPAEADIVEPKDVAAWIIPALAFTKDGKRLGYGGGWYDRLLSSARRDSLKIGVAHDFQLVEDLPTEPHDIRLTRIVTDTLDERHLTFTTTPEGFLATTKCDSHHLRIAFFALSIIGLLVSSIFCVITRGVVPLPLFALSASFLATVFLAMRTLGGPEVVHLEVKGDKGLCKRKLLGLIPLPASRFRWSPWANAVPFGSHYSAPNTSSFTIIEGAEEKPIFMTYVDTAVALAIEMNLAHHVPKEREYAAREAVLSALPSGLNIVNDDNSEVLTVKVRSLVGTLSRLGISLVFGVLATTLIAWLATLATVFLVLIPVPLAVVFLFVVYRALWSLFAVHKIVISGNDCKYTVRLGPLSKHHNFDLANSSAAILPYCRHVSISTFDDNGNTSTIDCFCDLPARCYLPIKVFIDRAKDRLYAKMP